MQSIYPKDIWLLTFGYCFSNIDLDFKINISEMARKIFLVVELKVYWAILGCRHWTFFFLAFLIKHVLPKIWLKTEGEDIVRAERVRKNVRQDGTGKRKLNEEGVEIQPPE